MKIVWFWTRAFSVGDTAFSPLASSLPGVSERGARATGVPGELFNSFASDAGATAGGCVVASFPTAGFEGSLVSFPWAFWFAPPDREKNPSKVPLFIEACNCTVFS
eukprot:250615-Prorocentrum_minimum.AAC.3